MLMMVTLHISIAQQIKYPLLENKKRIATSKLFVCMSTAKIKWIHKKNMLPKYFCFFLKFPYFYYLNITFSRARERERMRAYKNFCQAVCFKIYFLYFFCSFYSLIIRTINTSGKYAAVAFFCLYQFSLGLCNVIRTTTCKRI